MREQDFGNSFLTALDNYTTIVIAPEDRQWFKELVQRGSNLWPDAPPAAKEFSDIITTGKVLQDYKVQSK